MCQCMRHTWGNSDLHFDMNRYNTVLKHMASICLKIEKEFKLKKRKIRNKKIDFSYPRRHKPNAIRCVRELDSYSIRVIISCLHEGQLINVGAFPTWVGTICWTWTTWTEMIFQTKQKNRSFRELSLDWELSTHWADGK